MNRQQLEAKIKHASDIMRADDNAKLVTKYMEHLSWLLFLKVHEAIEEQHVLVDSTYEPIITGDYRWSVWTTRDWKADELITFVTTDLFPHLRSLSGSPGATLIARVFGGITTVLKSGYSLLEVIDVVNEIDFHSPEDVHTLSVVYESLLSRLGTEAGWSGEYYTPRPICQLIVTAVSPRLGEKVYDPAAGSCGFLAEAYEHMRVSERTLADRNVLQSQSFFGQESGELPFLLGAMNLILHGIQAPSLRRTNTLEEDIRGIGADRQYDVVLTNPPFGGRENPQIQQNFPIRSSATELLFIQHVIASLKPGGRCGIVVPDGVLFDDDAAFRAVRKRLLTDCDLHTIVRLPPGSFLYTPHQRLNLLFLIRGGPTKSVWFYEHPVPESRRHLKHPRYTKTMPLKYEEFSPMLEWWDDRTPTEWAWRVSTSELDQETLDLDLRHPDRAAETIVHRLEDLKAEGGDAVETLGGYLGDVGREVERLSTVTTGVQVGPVRLADLDISVNPESVNPTQKPSTTFMYLDLGAVDRGVVNPGQSLPGKEAPSRARRLVKAGDVLFSSVRPYLRGHAVVPPEYEGAVCSTGFAVLRPGPEIDARYLLLALMMPNTVQQCIDAMKGAHYPAMKVEQVKGLTLMFPATLEEQEKIADAVWPALLELRNTRVSATQQLSEFLDTMKDSEFVLLQETFQAMGQLGYPGSRLTTTASAS